MRALALSLGSFLALASSTAAGAAQGPCTFQISQAQSNFTWDVNTSLGNLVEQPNTFQLQGTIDLNLAPAGNPASTGEFVGANALVVPNLHGTIPNPLPFLPPLATVDVAGLSFSATSPIFHGPSGSPGQLNTDVVLTALTGTVQITSIVGNSSVDLAGAVSDPTNVTGTLSPSGSLLTLQFPVSVLVPVDDPDTGITGTLTMNGSIVATVDLGSGCGSSFFETPESISLSNGGAQSLILDAGPANGLQLYWVLGSATGTSPGLPPLPLNFDSYFLFTLQFPNTLIQSSLSFTDAEGRATAGLGLPPGLDPGLAGVVLNHAFAVIDAVTLQTVHVSNATALALVP
jgi:hypothetical protein